MAGTPVKDCMQAKYSWAIIAFIVFITCANGKNQEDSPAFPEEAEAASEATDAGRSTMERSSYQSIQVSNPGAVEGVVRVSGPVPIRDDFQVNKDRRICGPSLPDLSLQAGPGGELAQAVISIAGITQGVELRPFGRPANLGLARCTVVPHVQIVPAGTALEVENGDPILHHLQATIDETEALFDVVLPIQHFRAQQRLARSGIVTLTCSAGHPWMRGYVVVQEHPYYALTDAGGRYVLDQVPPGSYRLQVWHESLGGKQVRVTIAAGATVRVDLELEGPVDGSSPAPE